MELADMVLGLIVAFVVVAALLGVLVFAFEGLNDVWPWDL